MPLIAVGADVVVLGGGALEPGESLEGTARLELLEETGLVARELRLLTVCSGPEYDHTYPNGDRIHNVVAILPSARGRGRATHRPRGRPGATLLPNQRFAGDARF